jgi:hypothetical protein
MMVQVIAKRGGIGTSTFASALALAANDSSLLLDLAKFPGGIRWVSGAAEINTSWPTFFGDSWSESLSLQFERLMYSIENTSLFSGGDVPPQDILEKWLSTRKEKLIIIDGEIVGSSREVFTIYHTSNSLQEWNEYKGVISNCYVIHLQSGGLPKKYFLDELGLSNAYFYAHQKTVRNSIDLGLGIHKSSKVFKTAKAVLANVRY